MESSLLGGGFQVLRRLVPGFRTGYEPETLLFSITMTSSITPVLVLHEASQNLEGVSRSLVHPRVPAQPPPRTV